MDSHSPVAASYGTVRCVGPWGEPFIGSEALAAGAVHWHQLRSRYCAVFPDVYLPRGARLSLPRRTTAAWLWSRRRATITGAAAAAMHGARWVDDGVTIELNHANNRPPEGIVTRRDVLLPGEVQLVDGRTVTSPERTAFDIGRRNTIYAAVAQLDALVNATGLKVGDVTAIAEMHRGVGGLRNLETALDLVDGGAQSPKESWLRLVLIEAGFPRPQTQIPVLNTDGLPFAYLDMGWEQWRVAAEYEGEHHRTDRIQFGSDIQRLEKIERHGWTVVRVVAEDRRPVIVTRIRDMVRANGFECDLTAPRVNSLRPVRAHGGRSANSAR